MFRKVVLCLKLVGDIYREDTTPKEAFEPKWVCYSTPKIIIEKRELEDPQKKD